MNDIVGLAAYHARGGVVPGSSTRVTKRQRRVDLPPPRPPVAVATSKRKKKLPSEQRARSDKTVVYNALRRISGTQRLTFALLTRSLVSRACNRAQSRYLLDTARPPFARVRFGFLSLPAFAAAAVVGGLLVSAEPPNQLQVLDDRELPRVRVLRRASHRRARDALDAHRRERRERIQRGWKFRQREPERRHGDVQRHRDAVHPPRAADAAGLQNDRPACVIPTIPIPVAAGTDELFPRESLRVRFPDFVRRVFKPPPERHPRHERRNARADHHEPAHAERHRDASRRDVRLAVVAHDLLARQRRHRESPDRGDDRVRAAHGVAVRLRAERVASAPVDLGRPPAFGVAEQVRGRGAAARDARHVEPALDSLFRDAGADEPGAAEDDESFRGRGRRHRARSRVM
eukprot:31077-Pelagococcus_subviridis.AAC.9